MLQARQELASALGMPIGSIKMLERYRTEHGSHNTAFAKMMQDEANKLLVPWTLYGIYASRHAGEDGAARAVRPAYPACSWWLLAFARCCASRVPVRHGTKKR